MNTVKRISPRSAFRMGLVIYGFLGVFMGVFLAIAGVVGALFPNANRASSSGLIFGALALGVPVAYGVLGGAMAALGAFIYNVAARWVGGLQVEMN